ncbi:MAG TPA: universal stress protein [Steroidobacteraceae bacterium]|nr:universal stress protein [Steroidobacteraceae bacterium]
MYANILVPVDGSETSKLALEEAIRLARSQGSRLRLLHVVNEYVFDDPCAPSALTGSVIESLREGGQKILAEAQARVAREGVACDAILLESLGGPAAKFIVEQAQQWPAALVVMGTHGRRGLARLTLGSDAEHVVRASPVPVLVVHGKLPQQAAQKQGATEVRAA